MRSFLSGVNSRPEGTSIRIARVRVSCTTACPISRMRTSWPARIAISELVSPGRSPPEKLMRMILFMQKAKASACVARNRPAHSDYQLRGTLQLAQPCCGVCSLKGRRKHASTKKEFKVAEIWKGCKQNCRQRDASKKERHVALGKRREGRQGQEPQTGDRHRPF